MTIIILIATLIGKLSFREEDIKNEIERPLYDMETLLIIKRYGLITDDQYKQMLSNVNKTI
ncbi:hypothetical protein [Clostridium baratii]